jgi:hypothetical protein
MIKTILNDLWNMFRSGWIVVLGCIYSTLMSFNPDAPLAQSLVYLFVGWFVADIYVSVKR